jgi:NADH dehydrogenase
MKSLVVLGAGYGGLMTALKIEAQTKGMDDVEVVLVDRNDYHQYLHLSYEIATNVKKVSDLTIPLSELLQNRKIRFMQATVSEIDLAGKKVKTDKGDVPYHAVAVALGSQPNYFHIKGAEEFSLCLCSVESAAKIRDELHKLFQEAEKPSVVVGGGGFTGVELAGEIADEFNCCVTIIEGADALLPSWNIPKFSEKVSGVLTEMGTKLVLGKRITEVKPNLIVLNDGTRIESGIFIWTAGVQASAVIGKSGLKTGKGGRAVINEYCEAVDHPEVYVVGDSALVVDASGAVLPQCIEMALQQAETVAANMVAAVTGAEKTVFRPQFNGLILAVGEKFGIGKVFGVTVEGRIAQMIKRLIHLQYVYEVAGVKEVLKETL